MDETEYLTSTPANAAHLERSIQQDREGRAQVRELIDGDAHVASTATAEGRVSATPPQPSNDEASSVAE